MTPPDVFLFRVLAAALVGTWLLIAVHSAGPSSLWWVSVCEKCGGAMGKTQSCANALSDCSLHYKRVCSGCGWTVRASREVGA